MNSRVIASQLGEAVDQEAATAELSSLQDSIQIIAHVAHAVAIKQLDLPQAYLQAPSLLALSSSQSSSKSQLDAPATAASDPPPPEPIAEAQVAAGRADRQFSLQRSSISPRRGSIHSPLPPEPTSPSREGTDVLEPSRQVVKGPEHFNGGAGEIIFTDALQPSSPANSGADLANATGTSASSIRSPALLGADRAAAMMTGANGARAPLPVPSLSAKYSGSPGAQRTTSTKVDAAWASSSTRSGSLQESSKVQLPDFV